MKNLVDKVSDKLKIALGRKLSKPQMAETRSKSSNPNDPSWDNPDENSEEVMYSSEQTWTIYTTTKDASHSYKTHTGNYPVEHRTREYNAVGLLLRKIVSTNEPFGPLTSYKETVYRPAGRLVGKRVKH